MVEKDHTTRRNVLKRGAGGVAVSITGIGLVGSVSAVSGSVIRMEADPDGGTYDFFVRGSFYEWEWSGKDGNDGVIQNSPGDALDVSGSVSDGYFSAGWDELQVDQEVSPYDIEPYSWGIEDGVTVTVDGEEV